MHKYSSNGMRSVNAETAREAAELFAGRLARQHYGRRGYARTCTINAQSKDGSVSECSAFIGYTTGRNETTGHNVHFTVSHV